MTTLIIAEKPNMADDIARAIGVMKSSPVTKNGLVFHVGDYRIIGAQGHLFELAEPEYYGDAFKFPWKIDPLPLFPAEFRWELKREKKDKAGSAAGPDKMCKARFDEIQRQLKSANRVIHAGDPDREGQLIVDIILREAKWKGPTDRLWLHAQTEPGIISAMKNIRPNSERLNTFHAAECRAEADWVIGMNSTRAYTALWWEKGHKRGVINVGRVITPLVGMIVAREEAIKNFVPTNHFSLSAIITIPGKGEFKANWVRPADQVEGMDPTGKMLIDKSVVQAIQKTCDQKPATITKMDKVPKKEPPPLLFNLLELQKAAAGLGYSPAETLEGAQQLYDKYKLVSYPRGDCQYAPESKLAEVRDVLNTAKANLGDRWDFSHDVDVKRKPRSFNDAKLTEHFAILPLPTRCDISTLSKRESELYYLILRQYIAQFCSDSETISTVIEANIGDHAFKATGSIPVSLGWKSVFPTSEKKQKSTDSKEELVDKLPNVSVGDTGTADPVSIESKKTTPPVRYTAATILDAMAEVWKLVTNPEIKKRLKDIEGLGTPATRDAMIEKAIESNFIVTEQIKKVITYIPTKKAYAIVKMLPKLIIEPDLTAFMEGKLEGIVRGETTPQEFKNILYSMVNKIIGPTKDAALRTSILAAMPSPEDIATPVAKVAPKSKSKGR